MNSRHRDSDLNRYLFVDQAGARKTESDAEFDHNKVVGMVKDAADHDESDDDRRVDKGVSKADQSVEVLQNAGDENRLKKLGCLLNFYKKMDEENLDDAEKRLFNG